MFEIKPTQTKKQTESLQRAKHAYLSEPSSKIALINYCMRPFKNKMHFRRFVFFIFIFDHYEIVIILQNLQNCITEFEKNKS